MFPYIKLSNRHSHAVRRCPCNLSLFHEFMNSSLNWDRYWCVYSVMNLSYSIHARFSTFSTKLFISPSVALYDPSICMNSLVVRSNFLYTSNASLSSGIWSANCFAIT